MQEPWYFISGKFVRKPQALISVNDLGIVRGYGVFDFLVTYNQKPFLLREHLKRLDKSARMLSIPFRSDKTHLEEITKKLIQKNSFLEDQQIRIIVTAGVGKDNLTPNGKPTLIITSEKRHVYPKKCYREGVRVITYENSRTIPEAKTLNYISGVKANAIAQKKRSFEAIYTHKGNVLEGTTSNIFIIKRGKISTPDSDILRGITRGTVMKLYRKHSKVVEKKISLDELYSADEVFITSTSKEIMPATRVNGRQISDGKVGIITKQLMSEYRNLTNIKN